MITHWIFHTIHISDSTTQHTVSVLNRRGKWEHTLCMMLYDMTTATPTTTTTAAAATTTQATIHPVMLLDIHMRVRCHTYGIGLFLSVRYLRICFHSRFSVDVVASLFFIHSYCAVCLMFNADGLFLQHRHRHISELRASHTQKYTPNVVATWNIFFVCQFSMCASFYYIGGLCRMLSQFVRRTNDFSNVK